MSTEDTFIFTRISEEDCYSALFIRSSFSTLAEIANLFSETGFKTSPSNNLLANLEAILISINKFIFGVEGDGKVSFHD